MIGTNRFAALALVAAVFTVPDTAHSQVKPFWVVGGGSAPLGVNVAGVPGPHDATGRGAFLGRYEAEGVFTSLSFTPEGGTFEGTTTFVAANGDELACTYGDTDNGAAAPGIYFPVPAGDGLFRIVFWAEFNPILDECTGRFSKLTDGSFFMLAMTEPIELIIDEDGYSPPFDYKWIGRGTLTFARGPRP